MVLTGYLLTCTAPDLAKDFALTATISINSDQIVAATEPSTLNCNDLVNGIMSDDKLGDAAWTTLSITENQMTSADTNVLVNCLASP